LHGAGEGGNETHLVSGGVTTGKRCMGSM
jgi:hypothetical protein